MAIRVVEDEEWERARDLRLRALADAPEAFARSLEEEERLSESAWRERIAPSDNRLMTRLTHVSDGALACSLPLR
jgi:hypothetical protein